MSFSRREFMAAVPPFFLPRYVLGGTRYTPPSERLNVAMIGTGGQGMQNLRNLLRESDVHIVALADVAEEADYSHSYHKVKGGRKPGYKRVQQTYAQDPARKDLPDCAVYVDFRRMLDEQAQHIDAVVVSTPDHTHAVAALAAIGRGKHVYVEKPLARTVYEARVMTEAARQAGVVTQMGIQGHGDEGLRLTCEWIRDGAIGTVREVHAYSDGVSRRDYRQEEDPESMPIPKGFDWKLWLGPAAHRPYSPQYAPIRWRDFWDFGTGRIGDMGCHNMDPAFFVLDLGYPEWVQARCAWGHRNRRPFAALIYYQFPARGSQPPVKMTWYTGLMPPRPEELDPGLKLNRGNGILFIGDKGKLMCPGWAGPPRLIPMARMKAYQKQRPPKTLPRVGGIYRDWINACKTGSRASADFNYSGPMTEVILAGVVAMRTGEMLYWDGPNMKATNCPQAQQYIRPEYHNGWKLT